MSPQAALRAWDVVWPHDDLAYPPKWKLWTCVHPGFCWFLRISSRRYTSLCVELAVADHAGFLTVPSYLGCGGDLIALTEPELVEAMQRQKEPARRGIVGCVHASVRDAVRAAIGGSPLLTPHQVQEIIKALS